MKNTMKIFLAISILCTAVFAGDQGNGGRACNPNDPNQSCSPAAPAPVTGQGLTSADPGFYVIFGQALRTAVVDFIEAVSPYGR